MESELTPKWTKEQEDAFAKECLGQCMDIIVPTQCMFPASIKVTVGAHELFGQVTNSYKTKDGKWHITVELPKEENNATTSKLADPLP